MVGVNFPLPTPVGYYSHGGWKNSAFGDLNQYGEDTSASSHAPRT